MFDTKNSLRRQIDKLEARIAEQNEAIRNLMKREAELVSTVKSLVKEQAEGK